MSKRKQHTEPFNRSIPPLFRKGGLLYPIKDLGAKIALMVEMPEEHFTTREWQRLHTLARRELSEVCFIHTRCATDSELSQLVWLEEAGHATWIAPKTDVPRGNLNRYIEELENRLMAYSVRPRGKSVIAEVVKELKATFPTSTLQVFSHSDGFQVIEGLKAGTNYEIYYDGDGKIQAKELL